MKIERIFTFLSLTFVLQGCSLFNNSPCHDEQVLDSVKKRYANQININPLSKIDQLRARLTQNSAPVQEDSQSIVGIELKQVKQLDIEKLKAENTQESQAILDIIDDRFEGAQYICKATIKQEINTSKLTEIAQQLSPENSKLIQKNKLNIPIIYAIYTQDGNKPYDVQYSPENTLHLMLAIMLKKAN